MYSTSTTRWFCFALAAFFLGLTGIAFAEYVKLDRGHPLGIQTPPIVQGDRTTYFISSCACHRHRLVEEAKQRMMIFGVLTLAIVAMSLVMHLGNDFTSQQSNCNTQAEDSIKDRSTTDCSLDSATRI